jgi:hypothetical protein
MSEISWDELNRLEQAKVVEWETLKARQFTKLWWHLNLGYWFWSRALLDRFYTVLEFSLLLPFLMWLVELCIVRPFPDIAQEPRQSSGLLQVLMDQPDLIWWYVPLIVWLVIANIVVCYSDRTYRRSASLLAVTVRLLCRWMWASWSG